MEEKQKHGGFRKGSGRKPIENKKKPVTVYLAEKLIEEKGGEEKVKDLMVGYVVGIDPFKKESTEVVGVAQIVKKSADKKKSNKKEVTPSTNENGNSENNPPIEGETLVQKLLRENREKYSSQSKK